MHIPFFNRRKTAGLAERPAEGSHCPHLMLVPTWDRPDDMGKEDKATGYRCYACAAPLTLAEAEEACRRGSSAL